MECNNEESDSRDLTHCLWEKDERRLINPVNWDKVSFLKDDHVCMTRQGCNPFFFLKLLGGLHNRALFGGRFFVGKLQCNQLMSTDRCCKYHSSSSSTQTISVLELV